MTGKGRGRGKKPRETDGTTGPPQSHASYSQMGGGAAAPPQAARVCDTVYLKFLMCFCRSVVLILEYCYSQRRLSLQLHGE